MTWRDISPKPGILVVIQERGGSKGIPGKNEASGWIDPSRSSHTTCRVFSVGGSRYCLHGR